LVAIRRALVSVYDKTGIIDLCNCLHRHGAEILSTGGTAKAIRDAGIPCKDVSDHTGFPEMMDGRVKTLHPRVHGGLLALRDNPAHMDKANEHQIGMIDMVVCNLYPFEQTVAKPGATRAEIIEQIDIGGPSMVRSGGKNHAFVTVVTDPCMYAEIIAAMDANSGATTLATRRGLAAHAFKTTARYDLAISEWMQSQEGHGMDAHFQAFHAPALTLVQELRYGENPHQRAAFYANAGDRGGMSLAGCRQLNGKELSYNNLLDADGALRLVAEFQDQPAAAVVKHNTPCGCAEAATLADAFVAAYNGDPLSAFGGIVALNRPCDPATARALCDGNKFLEVVIAPDFDADALRIITEENTKKWKSSIRLLAVGPILQSAGALDYRSVSGGVLVQSRDVKGVAATELKVVTKTQPDAATMRDLLFAWRVVKHIKSNAICVTSGGKLLGAGGGQTSRVEAVELALSKTGPAARGAVLGSDAFFPFPDSIDLAAAAGIRAVIQPGGSVKDPDVIAACDAAGMAMVFTGQRHFRH
jgi:phosphoribosylaminoimidazolecarboxamide formyltransferase/IMP cyclohydrolase